MKKPPIPENEIERLNELKRLKILDSEPEAEFDEITKLASIICETKIALVSLVDEKRQWFKSRFALDAKETPRDISFCGHAILGEKVFEVPNAELNPDFCDNPLFLGEPHVRFYAGAPLVTTQGFRIGTLCVIDNKEKHLNEIQKKTLETLAKQVVGIMELKISKLEHKFMHEQLEMAQEIAKIGSWQFNLRTHEQFWSKEHYKIFEIEYPQSQDKLYKMYRERIHPDDLPQLDMYIKRAIEYGEDFIYDHRVFLDQGKRIKQVQGIGKVIKDSHGNPEIISGTCRDTTSSVEKELKYKTILKSMSEGLVVQNKLGEIIEFNQSALNILGLTEEELLGKSSVDPSWQSKHLNGEIFPGTEHPAMIALRTGLIQKQVPMIIDKPNGTSTWISITSVPIFKTRENEPSSVITTFSDTTDIHILHNELEHTINFVPVGIFKTDPSGSCVSVNSEWSKITGIVADETKGKGWLQAVYSDDKEKVFREWNKSIAEELIFSLDFRFQHRDGKIVYVQANAKAVKDPYGRVTEFLGSIQDITKLKEIERFNAFYRIALDKAAIVAMTDKYGKIEYVNEMFTKISEYSREELIGNDHRILNSGKMGKTFFAEMWKTISSGNQWNGKICNKAKSGKKYWVDTTIVPFKEKEGKISTYIAIRRDITTEKHQENEIHEKNLSVEALKTRLELALTDSEIGVWEWEIEPNKLYWDDQMFKIYGVAKDQFSSAYDAWANGLHPEDKSSTEEKLKLALEGKEEFRSEFRVIKPDGNVSFVNGRGKVVKNAKGIPIRMIGINWDITKIKENEKALTEAKQIANESSRAKSEFLSTMSHEIRTPLNGIIGVTDLLIDSELSKHNRDIFNTILQSCKALLIIINDILDFSKIESGKMELEISEFDLGQQLKELLKIFYYPAEKKGISFEFKCNNYTHNVFGDAGRIGQIISNLVSNAIKFTKIGSVKVELEIKNNLESSEVNIVVKDTGVGIPEDAKLRMFEAFSQADSTISRKFGGTGLGLSISKRLTNMMGGDISFESEFGKGTVFKVHLKLKTGQKISQIQGQIQGQSQGQIQGQSQGQSQDQPLAGRVLVAEDNTTNQFVISKMLEKLGCRFHIVANGNEVLDSLRDSKFDLILMDCQMPEMDGYTATRHIRKSELLDKNIPIVAMTANALIDEQKKCFDSGMTDYLSKPLKLNIVEGILKKYLAPNEKSITLTLIDQNLLKPFADLQEDGKPDIIIDLINSFINTSHQQIEAISLAIKNNDIIMAAAEAHKLKSSAFTLGASALGEVCQKIELTKNTKNLEELKNLHDTLKVVYQNSCDELLKIKLNRSVDLPGAS